MTADGLRAVQKERPPKVPGKTVEYFGRVPDAEQSARKRIENREETFCKTS
jgi:hypothetical protein